jgi:hypothetical protein
VHERKERTFQHLLNVFNLTFVDALYNIKRKIYKTVCPKLAFAKVTFDRMVMIFIELVMFSLFAMQLDYCNIQRVFDQK